MSIRARPTSVRTRRAARIYTSAGVLTNKLTPIDQQSDRGNRWLIPAVHGPFFVGIDGPLAVRRAPQAGRGLTTRGTAPVQGDTNRSSTLSPTPQARIDLSIYVVGEDRPLATLKVPTVFAGSSGRFDFRDSIGTDKRIYLVPAARAIAVLPANNASVVVRRFDLDEALEKSGADYLLVVSSPPRTTAAGQTFVYQLDARSRRGQVSFSLDSGPAGMTISKSGLLRWPVPATADGAASVIVSVGDASGQTAYHTFQVAVEGAAAEARSDQPGEAGGGGNLQPPGQPSRARRRALPTDRGARATATTVRPWLPPRRPTGELPTGCRRRPTTFAWPATGSSSCSVCDRWRNWRSSTSARRRSSDTSPGEPTMSCSPGERNTCW